VARGDEGRAVGVVQLKPTQFPNGAHRAEVAKLLVHRAARGQGIANALMDRLEMHAREIGHWLLLLDTQTGSDAETLYAKRCWQRVGIVHDHARTPSGEFDSTTFMSKRLDSSESLQPRP
jgi:GNAT superfamily N-acetyltransferase